MCTFMTQLLDGTPRDQRDTIETIRRRLGQHFAFQAAQRIGIHKIQESARRSSGDEWPPGLLSSVIIWKLLLSVHFTIVACPRVLSIDKMDQNKCKLPTIAGMRLGWR